jgi:putative endopeptidase
MKKKHLIAMMTLCTLATGCGEKAAETKTAEPSKSEKLEVESTTVSEMVPAIELSNMDTTINPAEDFFRYANNNWLKNNPIPEEYSRYGAFTEIDQHTEKLIQDIIKEVSQDTNATQGSEAQKIRDFYNAGMDTIAINERGYSELQPYFDMIDGLKDKADLAELMGKLHSDGISGFFNAGGSSDPKNAEMVIMHLYQGGLSLTDRDDYLTKESQEMRDKYVEHVTKMFQLTGTDSIEAAKKAKAILNLETQLAKNSLSRVEMRDPDRLYNKRTRAELQKSTPVFNWDNYFKAAGAPEFDSLNVGMPDFIANLNKVILNTDLNTIKDYLRWKVIHGSASMLSSDLDAENFNFYGKYLYGQEVQQPRWRRILDATSGCLGEAVGQLYVEKHFPAEAKERMLNLVGNLRTALGERIKNLEWMSDETKAKALHKLDCINVKVGYPNKWKDYSKYEVLPDSYFQNVHRAIRFENEFELAKLGKPVDKEEWFMTPQTVNAYYNPTTNEICFPAGILQVPFFDPTADDAFNYGAIGVVIGHEMTHGFDDQGRRYDKDGNMHDWWKESDGKNFIARTDKYADFFSRIKVLPDLNANGRLTLGENLADHGGLQVAWYAYKNATKRHPLPVIDGLTGDQRFFLAYAGVWAGNVTEAEIRNRTKSDPHSLGRWRVNGALPHIDMWYDAFGVKEGDKMFIPKSERLPLW